METNDTFNALECFVCLEVFEAPIILDCAHTICAKCTQKIVDKEKGAQVHCPQCRKPTPLPPQGVAGLRRNRALEEVADQYKKQVVAKKTADDALVQLRRQCAELEEELKRHTSQVAGVMAADAQNVSSELGAQADHLRTSNKAMMSQLDEMVGAEAARRRPSAEEKKSTIWDGSASPVNFKVIMIGASGVGKTSLAHYFVHGKPCIDQAPTHGAKFEQVSWHLKSKPITLELWDTSGQERQRPTLEPYVRGADAVLLVFDCSSMPSIKELDRRFTWLMPMLRVRNPPVVFLLANKADRAADEAGPVWKPEEGEGEDPVPKATRAELDTALNALVNSIHQQLFTAIREMGGEEEQGLVSCYSCSAKTGLNCKEIVEQLQLRIAFRQLYLSRTQKEERKSARIVKLDGKPAQPKEKPCCI